jgi:high affinity Mn2+ porin
VLVGDGKLPHPGAEAIGELYYDWKPLKPIGVTLDYQIVGNPGYNRDRGPAHVFAVRLHGQF